ncbi:aminotransferase-like domain-containing protein [Oceanospirillum sediminis]|uniref:PLP-dependent aminotransferase family protein n=1 Tax=Oceanospirillum sediminis TaxID=2760088 RepID=A0A839IS02_9GAMM|nr:PLP-dependent aminotransferase family protein [Oceanospirillum sediminis]MBB1487444.1 PLP-dependent aminotransferase family protein [Oceanospirillum sediminis]
MSSFRYLSIASLIKDRIKQGIYPEDRKLPSIRALAQELGVSKGTVIRSYEQLEDDGLIRAREKSGFFPLPQHLQRNNSKRPEAILSQQQKDALRPHRVDNKSLGIHIVRSAGRTDQVALGSANPCASFFGVKRLYRILQQQIRKELSELEHGYLSHYQAPPGDPVLCQQVSLQLAERSITTAPEEIIVTNGAQAAITLALQSTTKEGDIVLIQSPCFYGILQCLEALNRKVIEIPQSSDGGPDINILSSVLTEAQAQHWPVKAIVIQPTVHNPSGQSMPLNARKELLTLARQYDLAVIEDDVFAEFSEQSPQLPSLKALDSDNRVLFCSSVSKTLTPKIRIGWLVAGRWHEQCQHFQFVSKMGLPAHTQKALGLWFEAGLMKRHLRQIKRQYHQRQQLFNQAMAHFWPDNIKHISPDGGFLIWIQLPEKMNSLPLYQWAQQQQINITPGPLFSSQGDHQDYIRINFAMFQNQPEYLQAMDKLGKQIRYMTGQ